MNGIILPQGSQRGNGDARSPSGRRGDSKSLSVSKKSSSSRGAVAVRLGAGAGGLISTGEGERERDSSVGYDSSQNCCHEACCLTSWLLQLVVGWGGCLNRRVDGTISCPGQFSLLVQRPQFRQPKVNRVRLNEGTSASTENFFQEWNLLMAEVAGHGPKHRIHSCDASVLMVRQNVQDGHLSQRVMNIMNPCGEGLTVGYCRLW